MQAIVGKQNNITSSWTVVAGVGTLVLSNCIFFDLEPNSIIRINDTTQATSFGLSATTTYSNTFTNGLPTFTWVFNNLPAGTVSGDTLLIYLDLTPQQILLLIMQYQKA